MTAGTIGIRTRGSDLIQWSIWTGDDSPELGQWVRLLDTGELGRVSVVPGQVVGFFESDLLPRVSPLNDDEVESNGALQMPMPGAWGRIGSQFEPVENAATEEMESPESKKYRELKADMPALGGRVATDRGNGIVIALDIFTGTLSVKLDTSSVVIELRHRSFPLADTNGASLGNTATDQSG